MSSQVQAITRRSFLRAAGPVMLSLPAIVRGQLPIERGVFNESDLPLARELLLKMVNAERAKAGRSRLELDELACKVASEHAADMADQSFLSHWGSDGHKPYHRYSFAGGIGAVQDNVSAADGVESITSIGVLQVLREMHQSMIDEAPPYDGHRKTILFPQQTHVGFGIALRGHSVRMDELYIARYVDLEPIPRRAKPKAKVLVRGKLLSRSHHLSGAELFYEPLPSPPEINWLREPRSYGLPAASERLFPHLRDTYSYPDGSHGTIDIDSDGNFRVNIHLSKKPGINTIMIWLRENQGETTFPAAQVCVRVE